MKRRDYLKTTGAMALASVSAFAKKPKQPNIIFIYTDQQSAHMMSCTGNQWLKTPAMDYIAKNGIRFERAYTANPVCSPARVSIMSGRFPGYFETPEKPIRENRSTKQIKDLPPEVQETHIAAHLKKAGYDLVYGGKTHLPKPLSPDALGFDFIEKDQARKLAVSCADYIKQPHDRPYFMWANFINPHDICFVGITDIRYKKQTTGKGKGKGKKKARHMQVLADIMAQEDGISEEEFFVKHCPPLPDNHAIQQDEPVAVAQLVEQRGFRKRMRDTYTDQDWRFHRWIYHRLTELVDSEIQIMLDALRESGQEENTIVIFSSDHGDNAASHKMEHKSVFYEESARVPFMVMHKGSAPGGLVDDQHLVSTGLDLLPTVLDYAGHPGAKADPRGRSVRPFVEGKGAGEWRKTLGVEAEVGRAVIGDRVKYIRYDLHQEQEQLLDLKADPGEPRHFTNDPARAETLAELRKAFDEEWFPA
jgi:choline-sulfatase